MAEKSWKDDDAWDIPEGEFCVYGTVMFDLAFGRQRLLPPALTEAGVHGAPARR